MHAVTNKANPFKQTAAVWLVEMTMPFRVIEIFADQLEDLASSVTFFETEDGDHIEPRPDDLWKLTLYCEEKPDAAVIDMRLQLLAATARIAPPVAEISLLPATDWVSEVQKNFPPMQAGQFFIYGQHYEGAKPVAAIPLMIDAGRAFGTGEHETTSSCLEAIAWLAKRRGFRHMLDMGCGTGILAIAMAKRWKKAGNVPLIAVDIDHQSIVITGENTRLNRVAARVRSGVSDGYRAAAVTKHAPYELIMSNILARPLVRFAPQLKRHLAPGGIAVLSGLLANQERMVLAAHRAQGLRLIKRIRHNSWNTLILQR
jgi:ribosomal protein L11 methyltransferase